MRRFTFFAVALSTLLVATATTVETAHAQDARSAPETPSVDDQIRGALSAAPAAVALNATVAQQHRPVRHGPDR